MNCELCGRAINHYHEVIIDGVHMRVCDDCAKYGKEIKRKNTSVQGIPAIPRKAETPVVHNRFPAPAIPRRRTIVNVDDFEEPIEDFGKYMKKRREQMGLSQEELAAKLQEKKNLVAKIEREEIKPDKQTAKKIEKIMGIKILEKVE